MIRATVTAFALIHGLRRARDKSHIYIGLMLAVPCIELTSNYYRKYYTLLFYSCNTIAIHRPTPIPDYLPALNIVMLPLAATNII